MTTPKHEQQAHLRHNGYLGFLGEVHLLVLCIEALGQP